MYMYLKHTESIQTIHACLMLPWYVESDIDLWLVTHWKLSLEIQEIFHDKISLNKQVCIEYMNLFVFSPEYLL